MIYKEAIFLTGAGGAAIPSLIAHLKSKGYKVVVGDMDINASGLYLADKGYILPQGKSNDFLPRIKEICQKEKIAAIVPLVDEELLNASELESEGIVVLLPKKDFIAKCLDKAILMKELADNGITVPKTSLLSEYNGNFDFPVIIKPRVGRGSRGIHVIASKSELESYLANFQGNLKDILIQEYIEGKEFTVSTVVWRDGNVQAVVPKEIFHKKGITHIAITRKNNKIDQLCREIQRKLRADGPFNVQLRVNKIGEPYVFEINPRFSTSITLTMKSGFDEIGILLEQALLKKVPQQTSWKEGVVLLRHMIDTFIDEQTLKEINEELQ